MRLAPGVHQRSFRQLLRGIERADVFPGILFERAPDPIDKVAAIGQELRVSMDDFLSRGVEPGGWSWRSAAGRNARKPGAGLFGLKQDDVQRAPSGAGEWIGRCSHRLRRSLYAGEVQSSYLAVRGDKAQSASIG